jgi:hypothetical protein
MKISLTKLVAMSATLLTIFGRNPETLRVNHKLIKTSDGMVNMTSSAEVGTHRVFFGFDVVTQNAGVTTLTIAKKVRKNSTEANRNKSIVLLAAMSCLVNKSNKVLVTAKSTLRRGGAYHKISLAHQQTMYILQYGDERLKVSVLDEGKICKWLEEKLEAIGDESLSMAFDNAQGFETMLEHIEVA